MVLMVCKKIYFREVEFMFKWAKLQITAYG